MKSVYLACLITTYALAQPWSGILPTNRAADWSTAGVQGGIPSTTWAQCGSTVAAYTGTGTLIQNAINACTSNHYVQLGAGTFTLSSGFSVSKNGVAVRGMGANQTFLIINGESIGPSCGYFYTGAIKLCASSSTPQNTANWTAGYAQGTTRITLSTSSGIAVGTVIFLDQLDDASDGYPSAGFIYVCTVAATTCSAQGGGYGFGRTGRATMQAVQVTNVAGGNQFDVTPPISLPNFRSGQSPGAMWSASLSNILAGSGIENLSVDATNAGGDNTVAIEAINTVNCWVSGLRIVSMSSSTHFDILSVQSMFDSFINNYIYDPNFIAVASYPIEMNDVGSMLIQNNILHSSSGDLVTDGPFTNSVFSYNFSPGHYGPGEILHGGGEMMDLFEGNVSRGFWSDINHGTHDIHTIFRNAMIGQRYDPGGCSICNPIQAQSRSRILNVVGNVMGYSSYSVYQTGDGSQNSIYDLGWQGNASGSVPPDDSNVVATIMRWGNWDSVTNAIRWCGNSSDTGWLTTCSSITEVPSGIASFATPVPSTEILPASFYLSAKPSWFPGSKPWPSIGPDVTGGNISNMSGHAYTNPAADCYLNTMGGPPDGSGSVLSFDANTCYLNSPSIPTVTTATATTILSTSAVSGGVVTSDGGSSVTSEGVCWGLTANPTSPCTSDGTATPFTSTLGPLVPGTLYHYQAFATNSVGTGKGADQTFTTSFVASRPGGSKTSTSGPAVIHER